MCTTKFLHKRSELDWLERQLGQCQSPYSIIVILSSLIPANPVSTRSVCLNVVLGCPFLDCRHN